MRINRGFGLVLVVSSALCAQSRNVGVLNPVGGNGLAGTTRSLGSVVNPAQGGLRVPSAGGTRNGAFNRGGGFNGGYGYPVPIYIGGYYPTPYLTQTDNLTPGAPMTPSSTNVTVVTPPAQPATPVVINYNYGTPAPVPVPEQPVMREQGTADDSSSGEHYLIAFKDRTIYAATAYWVDGDTLHYFTAGNVHNQASLALVDREFTQRLNKEAGLDVKIPAPAK